VRVAVIPARGGSKRIPRKNIREFFGQPMIAWSIAIARKCDLFDRILVSTEDEEIAKVARTFGAEVPFKRPLELADDFTITGKVMAHSVLWMHKQGWQPTGVCCIYATAPFIREGDLKKACEIFESAKWLYVFSATTFSFPIQRAFKISDNQGVEMFFPEHNETRSQDLEEGYHDAGQFYFGTPDAWIKGEKIFQKRSTIVPVPRWRTQDIDTIEDWKDAEQIMDKITRKG